jgi:hypothetical protein
MATRQKFVHRRVRREWFELTDVDFQELEKFVKELWSV